MSAFDNATLMITGGSNWREVPVLFRYCFSNWRLSFGFR